MSKKYFLMAMAICSIFGSYSHAQNYSFKIATWNVKSGSGTGPYDPAAGPACSYSMEVANCSTNAFGGGNGPFAQKFKWIASDTSVIAIGVQEGWNCALGRELAKLVNFQLAAWDGGADGVALMTRYGQEANGDIHTLAPCPGKTAPRYVVTAPVYTDSAKSASKVVRLFAAHMGGCVEQANAIKSIMATYTGHPQILMGDLNTEPGSAAHTSLMSSATDTWAQLKPADPGYTGMWQAFSVLYKRIDYVFNKKGTALSANYIDRFNDEMPASCHSSDHAGLIVGFTGTSSSPSVPTVTSFTSSVPLPVKAGTAVTWTANATGGVGPLQYRFRHLDATTGVWTTVRDYSTTKTFTWTPALVGPQGMRVWVRNAGSVAEYDVKGDVTYFDVLPATTFTSVKINFQTAGVPPSGYLADTGAILGPRGNGYTYGWETDASGYARDRGLVSDQRYDTLIYMQKTGYDNAWKLDVPNGSYQVRLVAGDPAYINEFYNILIEGAPFLSGTTSATAKFLEVTKTISVTDGRLTLRNGTGSVNNRINFIEVTKVP